jgi:hypothetical protein
MQDMIAKEVASDPKKILIIDLIGALATASATGLLLATEWFATGVPSWLLCVLAIVAAGYACFDFIGLIRVTNLRIPLAFIAILNLLYCFSTIAICWIYSNELTTFGLLYFLVEVAIVVPLACWELTIASRQLKA